MALVEFLRVRNAFLIYACILTIVMATIVVSVRSATVHSGGSGNVGVSVTIDSSNVAQSGSRASDGASRALGKTPIPLGMLLGIAGYCALVFAIVLSSSLNTDNERAGFVFTKPIGRQRLALTYMAIDAVAIFAAWLFTLFVGCLLPLALLGVLPALYVDAHAAGIAVLGLGIGAMWYGVLQAVTAGYRGRGGRIVAFSAGFFTILAGLPSVTWLGPIFHGVVMALNLLNPLSYFAGITSSAGHEALASSVYGLSVEARAAIVWCIALAGCALATVAWKRVEV